MPVEGNYVHQFTLTDVNGNGWNITGSFTVTPEPGGALLLVCSASIMPRPLYETLSVGYGTTILVGTFMA